MKTLKNVRQVLLRWVRRLWWAYARDYRPVVRYKRYTDHCRIAGQGIVMLFTGIGLFSLGCVYVVGGAVVFLIEPVLTPLRPLWNCLLHPAEVDELSHRFGKKLSEPSNKHSA